MDGSSAKFLFLFLCGSMVAWILFLFAARLVAWFLSSILGASVGFRVGGWRCLKDVSLKFKKGSVESVSISEIRLSLRQSLVGLGFGFFSRDPKVQVLICDLEVVMRSSQKSVKKIGSRKPRTPNRRKWMVVANMARFLSVSVTELVLKVPKATAEIRELNVDISKVGGSRSTLFLRIDLVPIAVYTGEPRAGYNQSSTSNHGGYNFVDHTSIPAMERSSASLSCESLSLSCEFGHDRDVGINFKNLEVTSGEVAVNLNEKLLIKNKSSSDASIQPGRADTASTDSGAAEKLPKKQSLPSVAKHISLFPEKVSFNLPKLDVSFVHREHDLHVENKIMGIQLKSTKSRCSEDVGESTRLDVQMEFSEIHLLRETDTSILEILKFDVVSSVYVPTQLNTPIRAEVDFKLGGTRCNIMLSRLKPWLQLHLAKKKKMVLQDGGSSVKKPPSSDSKAVMWTCTVSAPEMTCVLYSISSLPLFHGCSQSAHLFANNISGSGTSLHMELGEFNLHMADEYQECLKESLFGVETNLNSLMHIAKFSLDCGKKELDSSEEDGPKSGLVLSVDVTGMGIYFSFKRLDSIVRTAFSLQALLKQLVPSSKKTVPKRGTHSSKTSGKGAPLLKFNLERCSVNFSGDTDLESTTVADPKRVNYGSQGGQAIISVSADGTERIADIMCTLSDQSGKLKYSVSLDIFHFSLCMNKDKKSTKMELERARAIYEEYLEEQKPVAKVVLFDMQNAKFVRRSGGLKEVSVCSYFSASDICVRWEPDVHLSLFELVLRLKLLVQNIRLRENNKEDQVDAPNVIEVAKKRDASAESGQHEKRLKKIESVFAIDIETLSIYAVVGDGVNAAIQVQSIFSENARIGVLLEGLLFRFNDARVFRSSRMQISRIPVSGTDAKALQSTAWDWVIQGLDIHICMPFRLQLRAIEDAVEDMSRCLKLITTAKTKLIFPLKENSKPKKSSSTKFGCIKLCIRRLTADIEEEPIQGWLDEHYHLMKNEACELAVRMKYLEDLVLKGSQSCEPAEVNDCGQQRKFSCNGAEVDIDDPSAVYQLQEELYKQSFRSYFKACQNLVPSEGSGCCREGFQAGFKPSTARNTLLSICATELDVCLTRIPGGDSGMIEVLKKLDPVCEENDIPFSRLLGRNIHLNTGSLAVHLRNYAFPLFSATSGKCEGQVVLAQQATCFQPQIHQDVFIGRWRKVRMLRSASGTTPPMKTYMNLPIYFEKAEVSFGVGYEPCFADISYAFTVALRRANLSLRADPSVQAIQPPKKERSLPWWDDVRNYIHGHATLSFSETKWYVLATTDPYEKLDKLVLFTNNMEIEQSDGRVSVSAEDFKILISSLESLVKNRCLNLPNLVPDTLLEVPAFSLEVKMDWECESGNPLNHYLHALPNEGKPREKVFDPFRSTSLSLRWNFLLRPSTRRNDNVVDATVHHPTSKSDTVTIDSPSVHIGAHDLAWAFKFWNLMYIPPHKLRSFSRWPRFGIPRVTRSGNLSMDKVMTEFMLRIDAAPTCIKHVPLHDDDPAKGLTFKIAKLKYELCFSRGKQKYTFECRRDPLDLVYQGLDLHVPKAYLNKENCTTVAKVAQMTRKNSQSSPNKVANDKSNGMRSCSEKLRDDGFLLSSEYFTIRRQAPKADPARLLAWQEAGRRNLEMTYVRSEFENGSESDEHARSDPSDDDGYNVVIADNCQRVFVYGLKLLWTIENRDAVWSWVGGISKAFEPPKPSPSRQYAQRKLFEKIQIPNGPETVQDESSKLNSASEVPVSPFAQNIETSVSSPSRANKMEISSSAVIEKNGRFIDSEEDGTRHFMVNVIEPQFNLHSEDANGRFLLAAVSGRVLARSFHSVLHVGHEMIEQLGSEKIHIPEYEPEMNWKRMELSVMLEHVQAHVAPTDVDPGAGLQWLPKILRSSPKLKRTGALLERVFMPCDMYFRYTRHKGGTSDLKVKPLKELTFNSHDITATMTSRQFQVMLDVLSNLLFARLPKPRRSSLSYSTEDDDDDVEEEADEMVPEGVEEVELARVELEQNERELKLLLDDIRKLSVVSDHSADPYPEKEVDLWMTTGGRSLLVQALMKEFGHVKKCKKMASTSLRMALQKAAQLRLMEKDKNKSPSYAMRISLQINKVVWGMLVDGKPFAEAEINDMIYDFERDYRDIGVARFTAKYFVVRNCLPNAKSDMLLSAWNPPPEWGRKMMLRVDAKQGAPKEGSSSLELFQVEIYPLKIHLTETMYRMMWEYFFPEEEQDSQRRQEVWKVSTTAGSKRLKKPSLIHEASSSSSHPPKEPEFPLKSSASVASLSAINIDSSQDSKLPNSKTNAVSGSVPELRRTSSFDRTWEENVAESVANELVLKVHSSSNPSSKSEIVSNDQQIDTSKSKLKNSKPMKSGRSSHEEKKVGKSNDDKRPRPRKLMEFHNIKISQVELLVTYEGSRFAVSDLRLLMDTFHRVEFTGTWTKLFSRVKKHIIWGVLKSVAGIQGKKFKDKAHGQREHNGAGVVPDSDLHFSDSDGDQAGPSDQHPMSWIKRPTDGAGDGFVTSIRGLFNSQRRKAKAFVLRTMRGEAENEYHGDWSESDVEFSPFARQLTITKARKLIRRHTKKFRSRGQKGTNTIQQRDSLPSSPRETTPFETDSSNESSPYEDFND